MTDATGMGGNCEHKWVFASLATDQFNTLQLVQYAYYYCEKCLETVSKQVNAPKKEQS